MSSMSRYLTVAAAQLGPMQRDHTRKQVVERLIDLLHQAHARGASWWCSPSSP